jgi:hypothetical protein
MDDTAKLRADELTEKAIASGAYEDFREGYRARLRWLKDNRPDVFADALHHYNNVLVPNIANGSEPIREWVEYGRLLGELSGRGKSVQIDETGFAQPLNELSGLLLHLPEDTAVPALALAVPRQLSDAQKATIQLLVRSFG